MPRPHESLGPVLDFMRLLWGVEHGLNSSSRRMRSKLGITGQQRLILRIVNRFPGITAGELAQVVHLHPSTLTGIIQRLVAKRLLVRTRDARDTRVVRVRVGKRAAPFTRVSRGTIEAAVEAALRRLPEADIRRTRRVLLAIAQELRPSSD